MPMGTLTMKIQCQLRYFSSRPPMIGPLAGATAAGTTMMPAAFERSSGGNARQSVEKATGESMPPPTPCRMRKAMSDSMLQASAQSSEAAENTASANMKTFFVPKRSPAQPLIGMKTARLSR